MMVASRCSPFVGEDGKKMDASPAATLSPHFASVRLYSLGGGKNKSGRRSSNSASVSCAAVFPPGSTRYGRKATRTPRTRAASVFDTMS